MKGLEQGRAKFAYERAEKASKNNAISKEYKSYAKQLPMMIKSHGLGASLAFALSKSKSNEKTAWGTLYKDIHDWLLSSNNSLLKNIQSADLSEKVIELDSQSYRALTIEVLAFLNWLRRFAEGLIEGEVEN
jgi:CRISPR-associated protein Cmr5